MRDIWLQAAEEAAEEVLWLTAQARLALPPQRVLSYPHQVNIALELMANPFALAVLKELKGDEEFGQWMEDMARKSELLGQINLNFNPALTVQDKEQIIAAVAEEVVSGETG